MRNALPLLAFLSIMLATLIGTAIGLHYQRTNAAKRREQLKRQYEAARQSHKPSKGIHRRLVTATCEELRQ